MKRIWIEGEQLLGDYLMQTPAIRGIRVKYPGIPICYVTPQDMGSRPLIENTPEISRVFTTAQSRVMREKHDLVFHGGAGEAFSVAVGHHCSMAEAYCLMWNVPFDGGWYKINVPDQFRDLPTIRSPFVVLGRHSRSCTSNDPKIGVPNKCVSNTFWIECAKLLISRGITPVAVGAQQDAEDPAYFGLPEGCVLLYGQPLMNIAGVLQRALFTISVDTGIRHMAAAVGGNLLTLNAAIPLEMIRCIPQHPSQHILEPTVDIHDPALYTSIQPMIEDMIIRARRCNSPS